jgi:uncharacterized membrane protein
MFVILNVALTALSFYLGPAFYGYGYAISLLIAVLVAMQWLEKSASNVWSTRPFMLQ